MKHVLVISIGPVQDFIRAARKTRDLWYGSTLLSECARAAAREVKSRGGGLVFPSDLDANSIPNKIVALLADAINPDAVQASAREAASAHLRQEADKAESKCASNSNGSFDPTAYRSQIEDFLEFYAAWHPLESEDGFAAALIAADRLLAGRKAFRDFRQPASATGQPKSSLDGSRERVVVLPDTQNGAARSESLDGISAVKRFADTRRFVSTARIAADPWIRSLVGKGDAAQRLKRVAGEWQGRKDADVVNLDVGAFKQYEDFLFDTDLLFADASGDRSPAGTAFSAALSDIRKLKLGGPSPYYAILVADGDRMGKLISSIQRSEEQRDMSAALAEFARKATETVSGHHGAMIYAGGDDVLAFLPLDTAIKCAGELAKEFSSVLGPFGKGNDPPPSLSAGIAIVHFLAPIEQALDWARDAERVAKKERGSLAVSLHTRSAGSESVAVAGEWKSDPIAIWSEAAKWVANGAVSTGAVYKLRALAMEFSDIEEGDRSRRALAAEVVQCLRHSEKRGGGTASDEILGRFVSSVAGGPAKIDLNDPPPIAPKALQKIIDRLIICRHMRSKDGESSELGGKDSAA